MMQYDLLVIGAGPAGLAGAIAAAESATESTVESRDVKIAILEKNTTAGRKLLLSGSGQCNVTHAGPIADFLTHYGEHARFVKPALYHWTNAQQVAWLERLGVTTTVTDAGKVFPRSLRAAEILDALLREVRRLEVDCQYGRAVQRIERDSDGIFHIFVSDTVDSRRVFAESYDAESNESKTSNAICGAETDGKTVSEYTARRVLLTTGGMTYPVTGTTGDGYRLAEQLGHTLVTPRVALAPLVIRDWTTVWKRSSQEIASESSGDESWRKGDSWRTSVESRRTSVDSWRDCAGVSLSAVRVSVAKCERFPKGLSRVGDLLWTHRGLSGPVILDMSRYLLADDTLEVSFVSVDRFKDVAALEAWILTETSRHKEPIRNLLARLEIPQRLVRVLLTRHDIPGDLSTSQMDRKLRKRLVTAVMATRFEIAAMGKHTEAMVTCGGVVLDDVNRNTMESRRVPGLFFAGEILDVDGDCGGYNLQFAFSSGKLAGHHCWKNSTAGTIPKS